MNLNKERIDILQDLIEKLKINVENLKLFNQSLIHSSYAHEHKKNIEYNERLEFLGDVVLNLVISEYLYQNFPEATEGILSKMRAGIVSEPVLARKARTLNLGDFLLLGHGEENTGGRNRDSILANALEAIIGAVYLDSGIYEAGRFIIYHMEDEIHNFDNSKDYKNILQEYVQKQKKSPVYRVVNETGPEHDKTFEVELLIGDIVYGRGEGKSKKQAEQQAAQKALEKLKIVKPSHKRIK